MLAIKLLGGSVLLGMCLGYCLQSIKDARRIQGRLAAWISMLTYVRGQVACFGRPLSDILMAADRDVLTELGIDLARGKALSDYCRADGELLGTAGGKILGALAEELGTVWREEQVERLDYYITALEETHRTYTAKLSEKLRVRCTMVMCGAGGVLLLVW